MIKLITAINKLTEAIRILCELLSTFTGDKIDWEDEQKKIKGE